jgi:predicted transcriptional regulator
MGDELRRLRREVAGLSRVRLGVLAEMSGRHIEQIERGIRRTRRSTLERIVIALVEGRSEMESWRRLSRNYTDRARSS